MACRGVPPAPCHAQQPRLKRVCFVFFCSGVVAAGAAGAAAGGAAAGPGAIAIIAQVQVLSQMGKIGGGGGALGAFSEGFEWANAELPVSLFPEGNVPEPDSADEIDSSATGVRRWLQHARRSFRRKKGPRPRPGQTAEQAANTEHCENSTLTELEKEECYECGMVNGIPLMDKGIIVSSSLLAVYCFRASAQLIVTKCLKKDPWDPLGTNSQTSALQRLSMTVKIVH